MIVVTGPQSTDEECDFLAEVAGYHGAIPAYAAVLQWAAVTAVYCLVGWEACPKAVADVQIAGAFGLDVQELTLSAASNN